ncbi:MAG: hypothetical protein LQ346_005018 [Caloplaca aetnensis]|nr:MAG: hypothetical protein LQ346_005018 [Caloplaca aetnensis]
MNTTRIEELLARQDTASLKIDLCMVARLTSCAEIEQVLAGYNVGCKILRKRAQARGNLCKLISQGLAPENRSPCDVLEELL